MKTFTKLTALFLAIILSTGSVLSQDSKKLVGTWGGDATLQTQTMPNMLTMKITKKEDKLTGTMTDQYGTMTDAPLKEIKFKNDSLLFKIEIITPSGATFTLIFKMKITEDKMEGTLEIPEIQDTGTWTAARKEE